MKRTTDSQGDYPARAAAKSWMQQFVPRSCIRIPEKGPLQGHPRTLQEANLLGWLLWGHILLVTDRRTEWQDIRTLHWGRTWIGFPENWSRKTKWWFYLWGQERGAKARKQGCKFQAEGLTLHAHLPSPSASLHYLPTSLTTDEKQPPNQSTFHQHSLKT